jgi:hypothetical protein
MLIFGRYGATELERRHDDVVLGRDRALMDILFPRRSTDLLTVA